MFKEYAAKALSAKVMAELPISDGKKAYQIINFDVGVQGFLNSGLRLMPLIPDVWNGSTTDSSSGAQPTPFSGVIGFAEGLFDGGARPELLFLTETGVFRYTPWGRASGAVGLRGLEEQYTYIENTATSVTPQGDQRYPAQSVQFGNTLYFNFGDGGPTWAWDGSKVRVFGYSETPIPPTALGPTGASDTDSAGAFSVQGRIGTISSNMVLDSDDDSDSAHGILAGEWKYSIVFENSGGAYSATSGPSNSCYITSTHTATAADAEAYRRSFWLYNIPTGPAGTVARIIIRTPDLQNTTIADGDHTPRFLHRIPNNNAVEYTDNTTDGELGSPWIDRDPVPSGFYFMKGMGGSLFLCGNIAYPYRVWWSEQTSVFGATPESIIQNHFLDLSPTTGAITGVHASTLGKPEDAVGALFVFKERSVHFISGNYPEWRSGLLHPMAGLAGPSLIQTAPDGTIVWFGNGTFWARELSEGRIIDIGLPIKKRLGRVNPSLARKGVSWVDKTTGVLTFVLPMGDAQTPNLEFVWDHRFTGWRIKDGLEIKAAITLASSDILLISGNYTPSGGTAIGESVYAYGNSYPGYAVSSPTATYRSGWASMEEPGPGMHTLSHINDLIVTMKESFNGTADVYSYQDWDGDNYIESGTITASHPENIDIAYYDSATYDASVYRDSRTYSDRVALSISSASIFQVKIESSDPLSILGLDVYGPLVALPGGRTPQ